MLGIAVALAFAAVHLSRVVSGVAAGLASVAAAAGATLTVVVGGIVAAGNAEGQFDGLAGVQPDPAIRKMIGFAEVWIMQGLAGAAGIAILVWIVAGCWSLRSAGIRGRALLITTILISSVILVLWLLGYGAATSLLAFLPLIVFGVALLRQSRRSH